MKGKRTILLSTLMLLSAVWFQAIGSANMSSDEKKLYKKGMDALAHENYQDAKGYFSELSTTSGDSEHLFLTGYSYFFSEIEQEKSIPYLEKALEKSKTDTIYEIYYYLGEAYLVNEEFDKSIEAFNSFKKFIKPGTEGAKLLVQVESRITNSTIGKKLKATPWEDIEVANLGKTLNTEFPEYAPLYSYDKNAILFTARRSSTTGGKKAFDNKFYEDIYVAKKQGNEWKMVEDKEVILKYLFNGYNSKKHDAGVVYAPNGEKLYIYRKDKVFVANRTGDKWDKPVKFDKVINSGKHVPSLTVSPDGKTIYFVSTRKEGFGGRDIYKTTQGADGEWAQPINLGKGINSDKDEDAPFLTPDGKVLYFSSTGHENMGGYDVFKANFDEAGNLGEAVNMGYPINSPSDDIYFVTDEAGEAGYLSSSRVGTSGNMDLFYFNINMEPVNASIRGIALNPYEKAPADIKLILVDAETKEEIGTYTPDKETGQYHIATSSEKNYILKLESTGTDGFSKDIFIPKQTKAYDSFQLLKLTDVVDEKGTVTARELNIKTGLDNMSKITKNIDLDVDSEKANMPFVVKGENDERGWSDITYASYINEYEFDDKNPKFFEINATLPVKSSTTGGTTGTGIIVSKFENFYGYNENEVNNDNDKLNALVASIAASVEKQGNIKITIEASASRVPTSTHGSNTKLAKLRAKQAKKALLHGLNNKGVDLRKVKWDEKPLVQGPAYADDETNTSKYAPFQYVKVVVE
jgi:hypothetical protein